MPERRGGPHFEAGGACEPWAILRKQLSSLKALSFSPVRQPPGGYQTFLSPGGGLWLVSVQDLFRVGVCSCFAHIIFLPGDL